MYGRLIGILILFFVLGSLLQANVPSSIQSHIGNPAWGPLGYKPIRTNNAYIKRAYWWFNSTGYYITIKYHTSKQMHISRICWDVQYWDVPYNDGEYGDLDVQTGKCFNVNKWVNTGDHEFTFKINDIAKTGIYFGFKPVEKVLGKYYASVDIPTMDGSGITDTYYYVFKKITPIKPIEVGDPNSSAVVGQFDFKLNPGWFRVVLVKPGPVSITWGGRSWGYVNTNSELLNVNGYNEEGTVFHTIPRNLTIPQAEAYAKHLLMLFFQYLNNGFNLPPGYVYRCPEFVNEYMPPLNKSAIVVVGAGNVINDGPMKNCFQSPTIRKDIMRKIATGEENVSYVITMDKMYLFGKAKLGDTTVWFVNFTFITVRVTHYKHGYDTKVKTENETLLVVGPKPTNMVDVEFPGFNYVTMLYENYPNGNTYGISFPLLPPIPPPHKEG